MSFIGNLIWFIFGGFWLALGWFVVGVLWCITIIGIPVGVQCFKFTRLALSPFGKDVVYGYGTFSFIINVFWIIFGAISLRVFYLRFSIMFNNYWYSIWITMLQVCKTSTVSFRC
ncbi:MAG: YccF domain-containing protein [Erysipelotrichaceae bacterium]|nr:YccF domain-containing protein [Erysipelotrichaceae bacterium]